jgi:cytochrome c oxidase cbb3-type subunit 3
MRRIVPLLLLLSAATACEREKRKFPADQVPPVTMTPENPFARPSMLYAGEQPMVGAELDPALPGYQETAFQINEGATLYLMFNCVGCHAKGGGAMGPPFIDKTWIYGSTPRDVAISIIAGRPNGMPSFRGKLVPSQLYALVAYVRSLGGFVRGDAIPARDEHMQAAPLPDLDEHGLPIRPKRGGP